MFCVAEWMCRGRKSSRDHKRLTMWYTVTYVLLSGLFFDDGEMLFFAKLAQMFCADTILGHNESDQHSLDKYRPTFIGFECPRFSCASVSHSNGAELNHYSAMRLAHLKPNPTIFTGMGVKQHAQHATHTVSLCAGDCRATRYLFIICRSFHHKNAVSTEILEPRWTVWQTNKHTYS